MAGIPLSFIRAQNLSFFRFGTNVMTVSLQTLVNIANVLHIDINYLLVDEAAENKEETGRDLLLDGLTSQLSQNDKNLIIHFINGLKIYNAR